MAIIHLEDRHFPLNNAIASDDKKLKSLITPYYPQVVKSEIDRQSKDGQLHVYIIKPTRPEVGLAETADGLNTRVEENSQHDSLEDSSAADASSGVLASRALTTPPATLHYKAVCWLKGQYLPSAEDLTSGIFLLEDGIVASANLLGSAAQFLERHKELLDRPQLWTIYPHTRVNDPPFFHFTIKGVWPLQEQKDVEALQTRVDSGLVSGLVTYQSKKDKEFGVRIYRNLDSSRRARFESADNFFLLTLTGVLPTTDAYGQFWDLRIRRRGEQLVLEEGKFVAQVFPPKAQKPKKDKKRRRNNKKQKLTNPET